jgi:hypothetical protein
MTPNTDPRSAQDYDWVHPVDADWELELDQQQRPPATHDEAISEWVRNCGSDPTRIGHQWLLTDYDTFVRNPHYTGPAQRHPDEEEDYPVESGDTADRTQVVAHTPASGRVSQPDDEPPF